MAENQQTDEQDKKERALMRRRAEGHFTLYATNIGVTVSLFDVRLILADIVEVDDNQAVLEEQGTIILSPPHAKIFASVLTQNVKAYEAQFGEIKLPTEALPKAAKKEPKGAEAEEAK
jgi:hypothetical protein